MPNFDEIEKNLEAMLKLADHKLQLLQGRYSEMSEEDKKSAPGSRQRTGRNSEQQLSSSRPNTDRSGTRYKHAVGR